MTARLRVLIVDDHPLVRDGMEAVLARARNVEVVGTTGDGARAIRLADELRPDVVLLDIGLPDVSGVEVAQRLRARRPEVAIVVLTGYSAAKYLPALTELGVQRVLHKSAPSAEVLEAVHAAARGLPATTTTLMPMQAADQPIEPLTVREHEVLRLVAAGFRNTEIAEQLHVTLNTVEFHMRNLLSKLGVRSRTEAVMRAGSLGYALPEDVATHDL